MYEPPRFLTPALVADVVGALAWPAPYELEDWLPDGVALVFPRCTVLVREGFESTAALTFLADELGLAEDVGVGEAVLALRETRAPASLPAPPALHADASPRASAAKLRHAIHDQAQLLLTYLPEAVLGDHAWVDALRAFRAREGAAP